MAKKPFNPLEDPPSASSIDDEEQGEELESDSSSAEEALMEPVENAAATQSSESESGSEIETDSKSESERDSKEATALKRPSEVTSEDVNAKRAKKDSGEETEEEKAYFKRRWSEEDEIILLKGMIDFKAEDKKGVYEVVKESLSIEVSYNQFTEKIRKLKLKYFGKGNKSFSKPHDEKCLELSNCIWGSESADKLLKPKGKNVEEDRNGGDKDASRFDWFEKSFVIGEIAGYGLDEHTVKQKWRMVPMEDKMKVEEKWKALQLKEIEYVMHKTELLCKVASLIAQAQALL